MSSSLQKVWDYPTRLIHWSLALAIILNLFFVEEGEDLHEWIGYAAVVFIAARAFWGFFGAEASRWKSLPISFSNLLDHTRSELANERREHKGHNPLASIVYLGIWFFVISLGISGYMMEMDAFWGEEWLEEIHEAISVGLQVLIVAHLSGVILDSYRHKRKTWLNMINGKKN